MTDEQLPEPLGDGPTTAELIGTEPDPNPTEITDPADPSYVEPAAGVGPIQDPEEDR